MTDEIVRKHLRDALDEIIKQKKDDLHKASVEMKERYEIAVKKMEPIITTLKALQQEIGDIEDLKIVCYDDTARVTIGPVLNSVNIKITPSYDNSVFVMEEHSFSSYTSDYCEREYKEKTQDKIIQIIMEKIGRHMATKQYYSAKKDNSK
jgi:hypothetical protein